MLFGKHIRLGIVISTLFMGSTAFAGNLSGAYSVELNKTEIVRLSEPASAIIIGNPKIADVSVHSSDIVLVVGRGYGQTNLLVLNAAGDAIVDADIQVTGSTSVGNVRLYSGKERETYSCAPYCQPSPILGDAVKFIAINTPDAPAISTTSITGPRNVPQTIVGLAVESEPELAEDDPRRPYYPE